MSPRPFASRVRRWVARTVPRERNIHRHRALRWVPKSVLMRDGLWSYRRPHTTRAIYVGTILTLLPLYGVSLIAAVLAAFLLRANLGITIGAQFLTNPLTSPPTYVATYFLGDWLMAVSSIGQDWSPGTRIVTALSIGGIAAGVAIAAMIDGTLRWRERPPRPNAS